MIFLVLIWTKCKKPLSDNILSKYVNIKFRFNTIEEQKKINCLSEDIYQDKQSQK